MERTYNPPPMSIKPLSSLFVLSLLLASASPALAASTESVPEVYVPGSTSRLTDPAARYNYTKRSLNEKNYYGIPRGGVELMRTDRRAKILQELEQRVLNLEKMRKAKAVSPTYTRETRLQERLLRRTGNLGITHYRAEKEAPFRLIWDGNTLTRAPILTPDGIEAIVDEFEYDRALRMSPDDCGMYRGPRAATCRYQRRVQDKPQY